MRGRLVDPAGAPPVEAPVPEAAADPKLAAFGPIPIAVHDAEKQFVVEGKPMRREFGHETDPAENVISLVEGASRQKPPNEIAVASRQMTANDVGIGVPSKYFTFPVASANDSAVTL